MNYKKSMAGVRFKLCAIFLWTFFSLFMLTLFQTVSRRCVRLSGDRNVLTKLPTNFVIRRSLITSTYKMHALDDPSVESYFIPGAKVFDRFFNCPLGILNKKQK